MNFDHPLLVKEKLAEWVERSPDFRQAASDWSANIRTTGISSNE